MAQQIATNAADIDISGGDATLSPTACVFVGVGGDIVVDAEDSGTQITFKNLPSGSFVPVACSKVYQSGTTATDLVAIR